MPRRVDLHVGTPKSGTTHVQSLLAASGERLREAGISYPRVSGASGTFHNHQGILGALAARHVTWVDASARANADVLLGRLVTQVSDARTRTVVSAEGLSALEAGEALDLIERLGVPAEEVRVVVTARDLGRLLPSVWQQNVKSGATQSLGSFLPRVAAARGRPGDTFWRLFSAADVVQRWAGIVGADRVTVVTVPLRRGGQTLWTRFAEAVGIPPALAAEAASAPPTGTADNASLTMSQAELVRAVTGVMTADGVPREGQMRVRLALYRSWADSGAPRTPIHVPPHLHDTVAAWASRDVEALRRSGVRLVGSWEDLLPDFSGAREPVAPAVPPETARDVVTLFSHVIPPPPPTPPPPSTQQRVRARARAAIRRAHAAVPGGPLRAL